MTSRRESLVLLAASALTMPLGSFAQQRPGRAPRMGYIAQSPLSAIASRIESFSQGMRQLGYIEGNNIVVEWRSADGNQDRLKGLAEELVRLKLDVIVSAGPTVTRALKEATALIPIVMAQDIDPVGSGFVVSLAHPGGNVTGLATLSPEIGGKQLQILKEMIPRLSRVAVFGNSTNPGDAQALRETVLAAGSLEVYLRYLDILDAREIEPAFQAATKGRAEALLVLGNPVLNAHRKQVVDLAVKQRIAAAYTRPEFMDVDGLMYYGTNFDDLFRRAASYVDKILKGAKPADMPVERPTKFEFIINVKAAKHIGLKIPATVLARADKIID
jgi:putative ABC transport system substrate-binding protein